MHIHMDSMLNLSWARLTTIHFTETRVTLSHMLFCLSVITLKQGLHQTGVYHKGFNCLSEQSMFFHITHYSDTPDNSDDISHSSMLM